MTDRMQDDQLDREIRAFLAWQAEQIAGAPTATEMAMRVSSHAGTATFGLRIAPRLVWVVLAGLLMAALLGATLIGANLLQPRPLPVAGYGWIAFSTQPGWPEHGHDYWGLGGDIYLVRQGIQPKMIVSRGTRNVSNVCPAFSPDGLTLVYGEHAGSNRALVFLAVSSDGSTSETARLDVPGEGNVPCPRWSSDGTRVAYVEGDSLVYVEHRNGTIVVRGLDGSTLAPGPGDPSVEDFQRSVDTRLLSPTGDLVALTDERGLVVTKPDGSGARILVSPHQFSVIGNYPEPFDLLPYAVPAWSADGRYVVAMLDVGEAFSLLEISVQSPVETVVLASNVGVNGASRWPGRGDVSWQPVFP